jgi:preflagellin peptidase FlaK
MPLPYVFQWDNTLDILRVIVSIVILGYSCVTDWKIRRAPNKLWYFMGGIALLFNLYAFWLNDFDLGFLLWLGAGVAFIYALVYIIFKVGGFGGADAKSLIAIALMFPLYPIIELAGMSFPIANNVMSPVFSLSVLGNAVVLTIIVPLGMLVYNLLTAPFGEVISNPIGAFTGYKAAISQLKGKHLRLMHHYEETDGRVEKQMTFKGPDLDNQTLDELSKWHSEGKIGEKVWVTPKLPFLIPITLGFLAAVFYGDILMMIVSTLLGR